ncbi:MAG TPA: hypothetical protein PLJ24_09455, partial [Anaerolineae bacterium]|nr:hypothetical protein [Anaerolineae bacterium]HQE98764.1 hypothetical protein [Anaerolineae bacterium]HQJ11473.1 hypothetical protein [Anaerolineae bacterium]
MRKFNFLSVILILALLLASCGPTATPTPAPTTPAPTTEKPPETPAATPEPTKEATPVAREWPEGVVNILTVKLRPGMEWSDGSALTALDLVGTYNIYWAQNNSVWTY